MGFLDRLLGRKKDEPAAPQTAPPAESMPADEPHSEDEGEHAHDEGDGHEHQH
jgi:hypothetical protein